MIDSINYDLKAFLMENKKIYNVIGLMSGTSIDGIDVAMIRTDGDMLIEPIASISMPYDDELKAKIRKCFNQTEETEFIKQVEFEITMAQKTAVNTFLEVANIEREYVDLIGFHGQTITHIPVEGFTWQLGDGELLASELGIDVIHDFRSNDVQNGGQGAPLIPLYHNALSVGVERPLAFLNLGGVGNITYIDDDNIIAFDTGPGNALIDDLVLTNTGNGFDKNGDIGLSGTINNEILDQLMENPYFDLQAPKSLDRNNFIIAHLLDDLSFEDKVATLTAFTVKSVQKSIELLPQSPENWLIAGGGRHNKLIMKLLREYLGKNVIDIDSLDINGDAIEAEGFAYLAVRSIKNMHLTLPSTTGCKSPLSGGVFNQAEKISDQKAKKIAI